MDPVRLLLVRHGATILSAEDRFAGSTDVDLSDEGRTQAARLADRLRPSSFAALYASPMKRTMETARIVGAPHALEPVPLEGLKEINHGRWEGLDRKQVEADFPEEYAAWEADPYTFAPQGGESGLAVTARALPVVRDIVLRHTGKSVVLVSHKATIRLLVCSLLGIDARGYRDRLDLSPAALTVLDFKDPVRARLMLLNDTSHYALQPRHPGAHLSSWWDDRPPRG